MNRQMLSMATRRQAIVGAASVIITTGISSRASAFASTATIVPWAKQFAVGAASDLLVQMIKIWFPGAKTPTAPAVSDDHLRSVSALRHRGYNVGLMYSGDCAAGDFELSQATRGDDLVVLGTTINKRDTRALFPGLCPLELDKADTVILGLVARALEKSKECPDSLVEAVGHPIRCSDPILATGRIDPRFFDTNNRIGEKESYSPKYMTHAGTIAWKTNLTDPCPNAVAAIRSRKLEHNFRVRLDEGFKFKYAMLPPTNLRYA
jgi:hypothetical protein